MQESDTKIKKYITVTSIDLNSPAAKDFCDYLEKIINEKFIKFMRRSLGYEEDGSDEDRH